MKPEVVNAINEVAAAIAEEKYKGLLVEYCTPERPMPIEDKDKYRWIHGEPKFLRPFFNLSLYECQNCKFTFPALPKPTDE
jgi:hypothetical protein